VRCEGQTWWRSLADLICAGSFSWAEPVLAFLPAQGARAELGFSLQRSHLAEVFGVEVLYA